MKRIVHALALAMLCTSPVWAVYGANTGPGSSDSTFLWVGQVNGASGVAIAPHWAITAQHVGGSSITLNGTTFVADAWYDAPTYDLHLMHFPQTLPGYYPLFPGDPIGRVANLVGYGDTGQLRGDGLGYNDVGFSGTRRAARNTIGGRDHVPWNNWDSPVLICDLDPPVGNTFQFPYNRDYLGDGPANSDEGGLMAGDSGGAWTIKVNGVYYLVAVSAYIFWDDTVSGNDPNPAFAFGISGSMGVDLTNHNVKRWVLSKIGPQGSFITPVVR